jgi:hypothetical protein
MGSALRHPVEEALMLTVRKSVAEDADYLAPRLREADLQEVLAAGCPVPHAALMAGMGDTSICLTAVDELGYPVTMFGVGPHPADPLVGVVWALASDEIKRHSRSFLGPSKEWVEALNRRYPVLSNYTDCRNHEHHKWLKWCGFTFINKVQGPLGHPFYEFVRLRSNDV